MSDARASILATIRRSLGVSGREAPRVGTVRERLERAPAGVVPARAQRPAAEQVALFKVQAEAAFTTVADLAGPEDAPQAVAAFLRRHNLPAAIRIGADPRLAAMPWAATPLDVSHGPSPGTDLAAVSHAFGGVAETGTLALVSGPENPSTLNFLPDNHLVVLDAGAVRGTLEDVWADLRAAYGKGVMPRTVNFITGPSRSADIEQTLLLGAHGPRRLHILLVGGGAG